MLSYVADGEVRCSPSSGMGKYAWVTYNLLNQARIGTFATAKSNHIFESSLNTVRISRLTFGYVFIQCKMAYRLTNVLLRQWLYITCYIERVPEQYNHARVSQPSMVSVQGFNWKRAVFKRD
jgi:hypothetical protein